MKRNRDRICLLCEAPYKARNIIEIHRFCPQCFTEERNHELHHVRVNLRRAEKAGQPATLTIAEWLRILDYFNWHCAYCKTAPYQVLEHVTPVQYAGTTALNCAPACLSCNARKDRRLLDDRIPERLINRVKAKLESIAL